MRQVGHWTVLIQRTKKTYEHFDSLGFGRVGNIQDMFDIKHDLHDRWRGVRMVSSIAPLQGAKTQTCGRWVCWRLLLVRMSHADFVEHCQKAGIDDKWLVKNLTLMSAIP